jgi:hypothetical protein
MVFSPIAYAVFGRSDDSENSKIEYNGIEFIQDSSGYWYSEIKGYEFITQYNPEEISEISFPNSLNINNYANKPLYFVGNLSDGASEIDRNLRERFVLRTWGACLDENCGKDLPVKNCSIDNIIVINEILENGEESIYQEENCVFIYANRANQTKYADKFLFELNGI